MRYEKKVYSRCLLYLKDQSLAGEFVQDIFVKVFQKLPNFRRNASFSTWLYTITINHCIDYSRRKSKQQIIEYMSSENLPDVIEDLLPEEEEDETMYERFIKLLDKLPENHKEIIILRYLEKRSLKNIQNELDLNESAIKMRIKRAREAIILLYYSTYGWDLIK